MTSRKGSSGSVPACYAIVLPGLEAVAEVEISEDVGGTVKRQASELVVFRVSEIDSALLRLRTVEDVFLLAWGTDTLTYRREDLERIRHWTARDVDWEQLLRIHHQIRPKPKGKPSYRLVTQMRGVHGYRRIDARRALEQGLDGKLPASWRHAEENAAIEIWLTIHGATAVCGLRLSDRTMRHRTYKIEHLPASLRPTLAAAMVRLAGTRLNHVFLDPMCGAGTILAEQLEWMRAQSAGPVRLLGGDCDHSALRCAAGNLRRLGTISLVRWDATRLPLGNLSIHRIVSNPPFGKQLGRPDEIAPLYRRMVKEYDRVVQHGGRLVLLVSDIRALKDAARDVGWALVRPYRVRVLGQAATLSVWQKP